MKYIVLLSLFISGCVANATGPLFKTVDNIADYESIVYIYRVNSKALQGEIANFELDGDPAVELNNNGYTYIKVKPGLHEIRQNWLGIQAKLSEYVTIKFAVKPGKAAYIELNPTSFITGSTNRITWVLSNVDAEDAMSLIKKSRFQNNVVSKSINNNAIVKIDLDKVKSCQVDCKIIRQNCNFFPLERRSDCKTKNTEQISQCHDWCKGGIGHSFTTENSIKSGFGINFKDDMSAYKYTRTIRKDIPLTEIIALHVNKILKPKKVILRGATTFAFEAKDNKKIVKLTQEKKLSNMDECKLELDKVTKTVFYSHEFSIPGIIDNSQSVYYLKRHGNVSVEVSCNRLKNSDDSNLVISYTNLRQYYSAVHNNTIKTNNSKSASFAELLEFPVLKCTDNSDTRDNVRARHIVVEPKNRNSLPAWRNARIEADKARTQLMSGVPFEKIEKLYSQGATTRGKNGGDIGFFGKGNMLAEFQKAAFCLAIHEISPVIPTRFGFHILEVTAVR